MSGKLYLVGTPIGNLGDMSDRMKNTLSQVDFIAAEDTRVSMKLLNHLGIKKPLVSYYEHNKIESGEKIIARLTAGESCALVTDAGMPAISDPGEELVRLCAESGIETVAVPGPSAVVCAMALSALPTGRFTFEGFLSTAKKSRFGHLEELKCERRTMVFYEAPHKLRQTLSDMEKNFGSDRRISICREMTKLHEQTLRMTLGEAVRYYENTPPRGEYVLVIDGYHGENAPKMDRETAVTEVLRLYNDGLPLKKASKEIAEASGFSANELYNEALKLK